MFFFFFSLQVLQCGHLQSRQAEGGIEQAKRENLTEEMLISHQVSGGVTLQTIKKNEGEKRFCAEATAPSCADGSYFTEV